MVAPPLLLAAGLAAGLGATGAAAMVVRRRGRLE